MEPDSARYVIGWTVVVFFWVGWVQAMPVILLVGSGGFLLGRVGPGSAKYFIGGQ